VPNTHYRLARGRRLPERTEKARSVGRPPEWLEVGPERAQRIRAFAFFFEEIPEKNFRRNIDGISIGLKWRTFRSR
jgi:hypothetical protein